VLVTPPIVTTGPCRRAPYVELHNGRVFAIDVAPGWGVHGVASCLEGAAEALSGWRVQLARPSLSVVVDLALAELVGLSTDDIVDVLARHGLTPETLVVRVPSYAAGDPTDELDRLVGLGMTIAVARLDLRGADAGLLAGAPIDLIDLSPNAVFACDEVEEAARELELAIDVAHRHDWPTVARDVSRPTQLAALRRLGCDLVAGPAVGEVWPAIDDALARLPESLAS